MAPLKLDKPREVTRSPEGITVTRHFEDGSTRTSFYRPDGSSQITTVRTNPSTGSEDTFVQNSDGTARHEINNSDGSSSLIFLDAAGRESERTDLFKDENGIQTRHTKLADGSLESEQTFVDPNGTQRVVVNRSDGFQQVKETAKGTNEKGEEVVSEVTLDGTGAFVSRNEFVTHPDGSTTSTLRDGPGASHVVETTNTTTMPDGAIRVHIDRADGTDETFLRREYKLADGKQVVETQHDNRVELVTKGDGFQSRVTKFEDGLSESKESVTQPDGTIVNTTTSRGGNVETTRQDPPVEGQPMLVVTTRADGTRFEQTLDDERMVTTTFNPKGETTVRRQDFDGAGSVLDQDANGNQIGPLLVIDGEPLEARSSLGGDQADRENVPVGGVTAPTDTTDAAPAAQSAQSAQSDSEPDLVTGVTVDDAAAEPGPESTADPVTGAPAVDAAPEHAPEPAPEPVLESTADPVTAAAAAFEPDDNAPLIEIDEQGNIQVDDFAENVNYAYTVTETEGGGEIGPDPDAPVPQPLDSPLESFPAEQVDYSYSVTETEGGGDIGPDPDAPTDTFESF